MDPGRCLGTDFDPISVILGGGVVGGEEREEDKLGALALHLTSYPSLPSLPIALLHCPLTESGVASDPHTYEEEEEDDDDVEDEDDDGRRRRRTTTTTTTTTGGAPPRGDPPRPRLRRAGGEPAGQIGRAHV